MYEGRATREELEDQIGRYRALYWGTEDQLTRDALHLALKMLQHELEARDAEDLARMVCEHQN